MYGWLFLFSFEAFHFYLLNEPYYQFIFCQFDGLLWYGPIDHGF